MVVSVLHVAALFVGVLILVSSMLWMIIDMVDFLCLVWTLSCCSMLCQMLSVADSSSEFRV